MSYFRVRFDGYIEEEFDDRSKAVERFLYVFEQISEEHLTIEEWDEENKAWK